MSSFSVDDSDSDSVGETLMALLDKEEVNKSVFFGFDSAEITPEAKDILADLLNDLKDNRIKSISLSGNIDVSDPESISNQKLLTVQRIDAIRKYIEINMDEFVEMNILPPQQIKPEADVPKYLQEIYPRRIDIKYE